MVLGNLRTEMGRRLGLIDDNVLAFCWVLEFPLLEWNEDEKRYSAVHHPFTTARDEDWEMLESNTAAVKAKAYDIVLNGYEVGGGSIRIHRRDYQNRLFRVMGLEEEGNPVSIRPSVERVRVWRAAPRRDCAGDRSHCDDPGAANQTSGRSSPSPKRNQPVI